MPNNTDTRPTERVPVPVDDVPHAPFIFYEAAAASGVADGIICVTLNTSRVYVGQDGGPAVDQVVVAYLRSSVRAAINLRDALNNALLMEAPPAGEGKAN
jgi:hypothetical protein